ncbi:MAG: lactate racemase domain-containing protein [Spirochaetia bacterium]|jgi:nickel-dependent lactate racemase|nr:lactate racemase domain-containing protein [Spirochaetia bacterium]
MMYAERGSVRDDISPKELAALVRQSLKTLGTARRVVAVPPDITRVHSQAGAITDIAYRELGSRLGAVLPALGTHAPMSDEEIRSMYPGTPRSLFRVHDWRKDPVDLDRIPASFVREVGEGVVDYDYPVQANKMLTDGSFDAIISIGQVVPHEVIGLANHAKNIFVGTGGKEAIDKSHFLGAAYGMERMMGRADTPVRKVFNKALEMSAGKLPQILWILTVIQRDESGRLVMRGFYAGDDLECFEKAASLSRQVNIDMMEEPIQKAIVWLDPIEFKSTWLGNKAVYRTRMAMADGGELIILAPGLAHFGEDPGIDALIRRYGYRPSAKIRQLVLEHEDLGSNLSAAAHLIHGSSEDRFTVTYAPGPGVTRSEIESVGYNYAALNEMLSRYPVDRLIQGWNSLPGGEQVFFVPNPALGLWTTKERFES